MLMYPDIICKMPIWCSTSHLIHAPHMLPWLWSTRTAFSNIICWRCITYWPIHLQNNKQHLSTVSYGPVKVTGVAGSSAAAFLPGHIWPAITAPVCVLGSPLDWDGHAEGFVACHWRRRFVSSGVVGSVRSLRRGRPWDSSAATWDYLWFLWKCVAMVPFIYGWSAPACPNWISDINSGTDRFRCISWIGSRSRASLAYENIVGFLRDFYGTIQDSLLSVLFLVTFPLLYSDRTVTMSFWTQ